MISKRMIPWETGLGTQAEGLYFILKVTVGVSGEVCEYLKFQTGLKEDCYKLEASLGYTANARPA